MTKNSFVAEVTLKRILSIFKSAVTGSPCISNLSANTVFYTLSIFCWNFLNFGSAFMFCDTEKNFTDFFSKKLKIKQLKYD